jgi:hypothetical protein
MELKAMTEQEMTWGAKLVEPGIPVLIVIGLALRPRYRRFLIVLLGAITPALLVYAWIAVAYIVGPTSKTAIFASHAMWVMSFAVYAAIVMVGCALACLPRPGKLYLRYLMGLVSVPLGYLALAAVTFRF